MSRKRCIPAPLVAVRNLIHINARSAAEEFGTRCHKGDQMKQPSLLGISLLAISACAPLPRPPPVSMVQPGVAPTTTTRFDGSYQRAYISAKTPGCPVPSPSPSFTIKNGFALLQGPNLTFQGYVTPQGELAMTSNSGQAFYGQIDPEFVLRARVTDPSCIYDVTWSRVS